jgi:hypothetical protein
MFLPPSQTGPIEKIGLRLLLIIQRSIEFLCDGRESACTGQCGFEAVLGCGQLGRQASGSVTGTSAQHFIGILFGNLSNFIESSPLAAGRSQYDVETGKPEIKQGGAYA